MCSSAIRALSTLIGGSRWRCGRNCHRMISPPGMAPILSMAAPTLRRCSKEKPNHSTPPPAFLQVLTAASTSGTSEFPRSSFLRLRANVRKSRIRHLERWPLQASTAPGKRRGVQRYSSRAIILVVLLIGVLITRRPFRLHAPLTQTTTKQFRMLLLPLCLKGGRRVCPGRPSDPVNCVGHSRKRVTSRNNV